MPVDESLSTRILSLRRPPSGSEFVYKRGCSRQKSSGLIEASAGGGGDSSAVLKRKRPLRLDILMFSVEEKEAAGEDVVEVEGDGYSVCCKRGRRDETEDRYSAAVGIQGDPNQLVELKVAKQKSLKEKALKKKLEKSKS